MKELNPFLPTIIGLIVLGIVLKYLLKEFKNPFSEAEKEEKKSTEEVAEELKEETKGQQPTFQPSSYKTFANQIYESLRYSSVDEDESRVVEILMKMQNDRDVAELYQAYGTRQLYIFMAPDGAPKDLFETINHEITDGFFVKEKKPIVDDWKKKGIKQVVNIS